MKQVVAVLVVLAIGLLVWAVTRHSPPEAPLVGEGDDVVPTSVPVALGHRIEDEEVGDGYRSWALQAPTEGPRASGFTTVPAVASGVAFKNALSRTLLAENTLLINGSGVAAGDIDGDGLVDLYFCSLTGKNALYKNVGGWRFTDITESSGTACPGRASSGAVFADLDGDSKLDLIVTALVGANACFQGDGHGRFTEITGSAGLMASGASSSPALADADGDGDLDLYIARYRETTYQDLDPGPRVYKVDHTGQEVVMPKEWQEQLTVYGGNIEEMGEADLFYDGDGQGNFTPVAFDGGRFLDADGSRVATPRDWGLSVTFRDLTGDGRPDLYVCNDFWTPDRLWLNVGGGHFRAATLTALRQSPKFSMAVDAGDIDRDGNPDLIAVDMLSRDHPARQRHMGVIQPLAVATSGDLGRVQVNRNTLLRGRGDGTFEELAQYASLDASGWSWSVLFLDVDLDGWQDVLVGTGNLHDVLDTDTAYVQKFAKGKPRTRIELLDEFPPLLTPMGAYRNRGDLTFADVGTEWGFEKPQVSSGMATADLDGDGDQDLIVNHLDAPAGLYRNESSAARIAVRVVGRAPNTQGIGALLKLSGAGEVQSCEVIAGGHYLSHSDTSCTFAIPDARASGALSLDVRWPSGAHSIVSGLRAGRFYEVGESGSTPVSAPALDPAALAPLFVDESDRLGHTDVDELFNDLTRQPLAPRSFAGLGPGLCWADLDGDGDDDLVIGTGRGGRVQSMRNLGTEERRFEPWGVHAFEMAELRDTGGLAAFAKDADHPVLLVASQCYEDGDTGTPSVLGWEPTGTGFRYSSDLPGSTASAGCLALADLDGDGDLDLFTAGRVVPGRYGATAASRIWRNESGQFKLNPDWTASVAEAGMVSGATFSDLDSDGDADLVLAQDWGPITVLQNDAGKLVDRTREFGLSAYTGWWNGVATGDLDGDGRLDIVATGWGLNHRYRGMLASPLRLYHGDLDGSGSYEVIEAYEDASLGKVVPVRGLREMMQAIPSLPKRVSWYRDYALKSADELLGPPLAQCGRRDAAHLEHTLFLARDGGYEARALPPVAQMAPAFGVVIADLDGDGHQDIALAQGFSHTEPLESPLNAGRGMVLLGDGHGNLRALTGTHSGVLTYGDGRGLAATDYDGDGRIDLALTQNAGPTRLYHNSGANPGLRVRLAGTPQNPGGVGATLRLTLGDGTTGPAQEVQAGSGYWSQNSTVQILATPSRPTSLSVRWPGNQTTDSIVPPGAREVRVHPDGTLEQLR